MLSRLDKLDRVISQKTDRVLGTLTAEELEILANMREYAMGLFLPKMVAKTQEEKALVERIAEDSKILAALFFDLPEGAKSED